MPALEWSIFIDLTIDFLCNGFFLDDLRTELCRFSGAKIYPGKGIRFIRSDSQVMCSFVLKALYFLFISLHCKMQAVKLINLFSFNQGFPLC
jgi:ribosomal protein L24E